MPRRSRAHTSDYAIAVAAAYRLADARRELSAARRSLAAATAAKPGFCSLDAELESYQAVVRKARALHTLPGVVGSSIGHRVRAGVPEHEELVVTVFVREKVRPLRKISATHRIPKAVIASRTSRLPTDVIEVGTFRNTALPGFSIGTEISPDSATLSCFATDLQSNQPVALTVMHLIIDAGIRPNRDLRFVAPTLEQGFNPLGSYLRGTLTTADAMAIMLDAGMSHDNVVPEIGEIAGARPVVASGDQFIAVRMFGAASGRRVTGRIEHCSVFLPELGIDSGILASIDVEPGDSGAVLMDNDRFVLGILKGFFDGGDRLAVFSPITAVLDALQCSIS